MKFLPNFFQYYLDLFDRDSMSSKVILAIDFFMQDVKGSKLINKRTLDENTLEFSIILPNLAHKTSDKHSNDVKLVLMKKISSYKKFDSDITIKLKHLNARISDDYYIADFHIINEKVITHGTSKYHELMEIANFKNSDGTKPVIRELTKDKDNLDVAKYNVKGIPYSDVSRKREIIQQELGCRVEMKIDGNTLTIRELKPLPTNLEMSMEYLKAGVIFFGFDRKGAVYVAIEEMTHFLTVGISGSGKSVFLNQILASLLFSLNHSNPKTKKPYIEELIMVDFKGGIELTKYERVDKRITVFSRMQQFYEVVNRVHSLMLERNEFCKNTGITKFIDRYIFFIIDEYSLIELYKPIDKEDKELYNIMKGKLNELSNLSRSAGIRIYAQLQKTTTDQMDSSFKNNLQSQIALKLKAEMQVEQIFGDNSITKDLGVDIMSFNKGRYVAYFDNDQSRREIQGTFVPDDFYLNFIKRDSKPSEAIQTSNPIQIPSEDKEELLREDMQDEDYEFDFEEESDNPDNYEFEEEEEEK